MKFLLVLISMVAVSCAIPLAQNEAIQLLAARKANEEAANEEALTLSAYGMGAGRGLGAGLGGGLGGIGGGLGGIGGGLGGLGGLGGGLGGRGNFNNFGEVGLRLNPLTGNYSN